MIFKKFWKKIAKSIVEDELFHIEVKGALYPVQEKVWDYVLELEDKVEELDAVKSELEAIKPIMKLEGYMPPVSKECADCDLVIIGGPYRTPIGCRKNMLCESFRKKEV